VAGSLEKAIGDFLRKNGMTLSVAESCTGGLISDRITNVSGSSDYFEGGIVSYSIQAKAEHLHIPRKYIERHGAVSPQVAKRMAEGVRKAFNTTLGLSTTGVAGPTGGTRRTPVGTVFIGFSREGGTLVKKLGLKGTRREIKKAGAEKSLQFLFEQIKRSLPPFPPLLKGGEGGFPCGTDDGPDIKNCIGRLRRSNASEIVLIRRAPKGINYQNSRLGIFPASFNPPTLAHVALIREAIKKKKLDEVLVLLDMQAMDKEPIGANLEDRLRMLKKAFGKNPKISIGLSNRGLFLEKINPLRKYYPAPASFAFIVGFDTIVRVIDKKYYPNRKQSLDALFGRCQFLVANRGEYQERALEILFRKREIKAYKGKVSFITLPERFSSLSSSLVRQSLSLGQPVNQWVPASIHSFLKEKGLYKRK
jgi:nicotinate (nicotinamide) nucleotide adenylyltransferase